MKTIYVVIKTDYIEESIEKAFTDKGKAKQYAKDHTDEEYIYNVKKCNLIDD